MAISAAGKICIVCSDDTRNGKTLFARIYTDYLIVTDRDPVIIDAGGPDRGIAEYYGDQAMKVDLSRTPGQVRLFDTILNDPSRDYVVDLPGRHLARFFEISSQIGFSEEARRLDLEIVVFYMVETNTHSVKSARRIARSGLADRFVTVRNEALASASIDDVTEDQIDAITDEDAIIMPELDRAVVTDVEALDFSFTSYIAGRQGSLPPSSHGRLRSFLGVVLDQLRRLQFKIDMLDLRRMGIL